MSEQQIIPAGAPTPFLTNAQNGLGGRMNGAFAFLRQPAVSRALPAIALVGVLGLAVAAWLTLQSPTQAPLYAGLAETDKAAVAEALQASGIGYTLDPASGALSVDADRLHEAKMMLAGQGLPKAQPSGDAMLASLPMGASRAIEGETLRAAREADLGRTIEAIDSVKVARGLGSLTLTVGGVAHNLTITASNNSLAGLADAINATGSVVRASVVSDQGQFRLVLKGETGTAKAFSLVADAGADPALAGLVGGLALSQPASDAIIRVDGVEYNRPTNTITDIVPGVSLTLKKAEIGVAVSLGSVRPADALKQTVSDFVTVFNQLQTSLKEARQAVGGAGNLRALDRQLTALVSKALTGNLGINSLSDIGIKTDRNGMLSLDRGKLDAALASDPDAVEALFNPPRSASATAITDPGLATALDEIRDAAIAPGGLIEALGKSLQSEASELAKNRERMEAREDAALD